MHLLTATNVTGRDILWKPLSTLYACSILEKREKPHILVGLFSSAREDRKETAEVGREVLPRMPGTWILDQSEEDPSVKELSPKTE